MSHRFYSRTPTPFLSSQNLYEKWKVEKLFGSKFSRLNIEDEYRYNLSYLISEDQSTHRPGSRTNFPSNWNKDYQKSSTRVQSIPNLIGSYKAHSAADLPEKQIATEKAQLDRSRYNIHNGIPFTPPKCLTPIPTRTKPKDINDRSGLNRLVVPRNKLVTAHQPSQSPYPGLHIYVAESPPRPFYDVSTIEYTQSSRKKKSVACDPIISDNSEHVYKKSSKTKENNHREKVRAADESQFVRSGKTLPIAPKVQDYVTLFDSKEPNLTVDIDPYQNSNKKDFDNESLSPPEIVIRRPQFRLQRSATCNFGSYSEGAGDQCLDYCFSCCKRTYPVDRVSIGDRVYHKACFRCATCNRTVLPGTFSSLDGVILCKPHYIEQFRKAGRYELRKSYIKYEESQHSGVSTPTFE